MLKSAIIVVLLSTSPFMFVNICFMYLGVPMYSYFNAIKFSLGTRGGSDAEQFMAHVPKILAILTQI